MRVTQPLSWGKMLFTVGSHVFTRSCLATSTSPNKPLPNKNVTSSVALLLYSFESPFLNSELDNDNGDHGDRGNDGDGSFRTFFLRVEAT